MCATKEEGDCPRLKSRASSRLKAARLKAAKLKAQGSRLRAQGSGLKGCKVQRCVSVPLVQLSVVPCLSFLGRVPLSGFWPKVKRPLPSSRGGAARAGWPLEGQPSSTPPLKKQRFQCFFPAAGQDCYRSGISILGRRCLGEFRPPRGHDRFPGVFANCHMSRTLRASGGRARGLSATIDRTAYTTCSWCDGLVRFSRFLRRSCH